MVAAVTCVLAFGGCKKAKEWAEKRKTERMREELVHAAEPAPLREKPDGPGLASGRYRIIEVRVEALPTTRFAKPWDTAPGAAPDLEVVLDVDDEHYKCRPSEDSVHGRCKLDLEIEVESSTRIDLMVFDRDSLLDDPIGTAALVDPDTWGTEIDLPMMPTDRLRAATIVLARTPSWLELHRHRLVGLATGVVAALAALATFRRSLLRPPPPPLPAPTCTYCRMLLAPGALTCGHCGAAQQGAT